MRTLAAVLVASSALAQPARAPDSIDAVAVSAFADEFVPKEMARRHIPGAVFVFVSNGGTAIARGFGAAQLEPYRPVDPDLTVFRLASVSKTITATAALQLVEQGSIDLHSDVGQYLKSLRLANRHGEISLHHLLTHTAGFDERLTGAAARFAADVQPSSQYLGRSLPPTFIAPGRVISYSNHGYALIGQLVEDVSGRPFAEYVQHEIFEKLGMSHSGSLGDPLPKNLAVAYDYADGSHRPLPPDFLQVASAGAFYTTGSDLARFLIALLGDGAFGDRRILRPETVERMRSQQFTPVAGLSGWAYGLWEDGSVSPRVLLHNGGGKGFRALIYLLPEHDAGFCLAYNLADRHEDGELLEAFASTFKRRFLTAAPAPRTGTPEPISPQAFVGDYVYVRRARAGVEKLVALLNQVRVTTDNAGNLMLSARSIPPTLLTPAGPALFRRADGRGMVAFDSTALGPPHLWLLADGSFPTAYEPIPQLATLRVQIVWLTGMAAILLYAAIRRPSTIYGVASMLSLLSLVGFPLAFFGRMEGGVPEFLYGIPAIAKYLLFVPMVASLLTIAACVVLVRSWRGTTAARRIEAAAIESALIAFIAFVVYWRLVPLSH
jgi:CubicO group peptidase (beta-lactamase class C family)